MTSETATPAPRLSHARQLLFVGFVMLAAVLILSAWVAARGRADFLATQKILVIKDQVSNVLSSARQAESGQRGYLLTGNAIYLQPYELGVAALPREMGALRDNAGQGPEAADLVQIQSLIDTKLAELSRTIALYRGGDKAGAFAVVNTGLGMSTMANLRAEILAVQKIESARLDSNQATDRRNGWMLQFVTGAVILCTILLAWFAIRENRLQNEQLRAAQTSLLEANEALEDKVEERTRTLRASQAALAEANTSLEARVAERSRELDRIFKLSTDLLAVADFSGRFRHVSPAWTRITG